MSRKKKKRVAKKSAATIQPSSLPQIFSWPLGALLFAAVVLAYQPAWSAGYIWDDDLYVTKNPLLTAADGLRRIWFSFDAPSQYFPLTYSIFRLEHALWGFDPAGYHCVNILLHSANALLLWRLLHLLNIPGAWLGAAFFALHPVQVESVAWISELKNVLMGFFFLLTLVCWVHFLEESSLQKCGAYYAAALFLYALALFGKTTAVTLPVVLLLILWLRRRPITLARCLQMAPFVVFAAGMGVITIWWERYHQGTQGPPFAVGVGERVLIANRGLWFYLGKLIWPNELSFSYEHWSISLRDPLDYLWVGMTVAACFVIWRLRGYAGRSLEVAMLCFVAILAPTLGFIMLWTFRYSWVADHYQYLGCIGPLAFCAAVVTRGAAKLERNGTVTLVIGAAVVLASLGTRTWKQGRNYADAETLWRATLQTNPRSTLAHDSLGVILGQKNAPIEEEMAEYRKALEADPNDAEARNNLGYALQRLGRFKEAVDEYERSVAADPRYAIAHGNLATVLLRMGRPEESITHLQKVIEIDPKNALLERSLGDVLAGHGRAEEAIKHWERAIDLGAKDADLSAKVGRLLAATGKLEDALFYLRYASELSPAEPQTHFNYAAALSLLGRFTSAVPEYQQAIRLQPDLAEAHSSLAICLMKIGRFDEAVAEYKRTIELKPNDRAAHQSLSLVLRYLGEAAEADAYALPAAQLASPRSTPP